MTLVFSGHSATAVLSPTPRVKLGSVGKGLAVITLTSAFLVPITDGLWSTSLADDPYKSPRSSFEYVTSGGASPNITVGSSESANSSESGTVSGLRLVSGMTADQLARLFGVSRRSVQNWVAGGQMASFHEERLSHLYSVVLATGDTPEKRRMKLLSSANGMSIFHQLIGELDQGPILEPSAISARAALGV